MTDAVAALDAILARVPEEPSVYSLLVDGVVVEELMAWPAAWERPGQ